MTSRVQSSYIVRKAGGKVGSGLHVYGFILVRAYKHDYVQGLIKQQGKFYPLIFSRALKQVFSAFSKAKLK